MEKEIPFEQLSRCMDWESTEVEGSKTVLNVKVLQTLRQKHVNNPHAKKWFVFLGYVPVTYPRWANVGLSGLVNLETRYVNNLVIVLNRELKVIHIVDPTNAHFYEDWVGVSRSTRSPQGIWMDVAEELKSKLKYLLNCCCQSKSRKKCSCYKGWEVDFFRCKELDPMTADILRDGNEFYLTLLPDQQSSSSPEDSKLSPLNREQYVERTMKFLHVGSLAIGMAACYYMKLHHGLEFRILQNEEQKNKVEFWDSEELEAMAQLSGGKKVFEEIQEEMERMKENDTGRQGASQYQQKTERACNLCGKINDLKYCARCTKASYCGKECQKKDWRNHKGNCLRPVPDGYKINLPTGQVELFAVDGARQREVSKAMFSKLPNKIVDLNNLKPGDEYADDGGPPLAFTVENSEGSFIAVRGQIDPDTGEFIPDTDPGLPKRQNKNKAKKGKGKRKYYL